MTLDADLEVIRGELSQIADVLWRHAQNMMKGWEYNRPRPRRGTKNAAEQLAAWEHAKSDAHRARFQALLDDGFNRLHRVIGLLGLHNTSADAGSGQRPHCQDSPATFSSERDE